MTPKEKAKELVCNFYAIQSNEYNYGINWGMAKQCALIAVNEILDQLDEIINITGGNYVYNILDYWTEVKQEIEKI